MSTTKRMAKRLLSVVLTVLMLLSMVTIGMTSMSAANVEMVETAAAGTIKVYFENNWKWSDIRVHYWGGTVTSGTWPGKALTKDGKNGDGTNDVYVAEIPADTTAIIFNGLKNDGSGYRDQTPDITSGWYEGICYYMMWDDGNKVGTYDYKVPVVTEAPTTTAPATTVAPTTTTPATTVAPTTTTPATTTTPVVTTTTPAVSDPVEDSSAVATKDEPATDPVVTDPVVTDPVVTDPVKVTLAWGKADGLYAYASVTDKVGNNAWQRWDNVSGREYRYFYLPASASDTEVIIYNAYSEAVTINGVEIPAGEYKTVAYENGEVYACTGASTSSVKIMKSDAEGALFINSAEGMTTKNDAGTKNTVNATYDLYAFLTSGSKNQEAGKAQGAVADADGVSEDTLVKKIKGRGNSTWNLSKKPFNITYDENIQLDGMKGKKWSLLANAQDPSLLRNRLVYDLANEVDMTYACDSRFVDWFVNGDYKGSYQLTQKIEMGKNTVMPDLTEPEVEDVVEDDGTITPYPKSDFDFILELDTEKNAASSGDKGFKTTRGQWMTFKTPDDPATEQWNFMKAKYQAVEDALYTGDIATLEKLVNLDDFARAYLVNEVSKNLDAGVTSCYFTYNSETGMFTTAPVWDYDNALGNSVSIADRHDVNGKMLDVTGPTGWYARDLAHYDLGTLNVFGQACATTSKNAAGETFNDVVKRIWNDEFMPAIAVLEGAAKAQNGRLDSVAGYMTNLKNSGQWNYNYAGWGLTANNGWVANHSSLAMYDYDAATNTLSKTTKTYDQYTLEGQANYAGDWMISRMNWMAAEYAAAETVKPTGSTTVYFQNNWMWTNVKAYYWDESGTAISAAWPGESMDVYENDGTYDYYVLELPADATGLIFNGTKNDGSGATDQSPNIEGGWYDGICYYMDWKDGNAVGSWAYNVPEVTTSAPADTTPSTPATGDEVTSDPVETTTVVEDTTVAEDTTTVVASDDEEETTVVADTTVADDTTVIVPDTTVVEEEDDTITVYFKNEWMWTNVSIYYWTAAGVAKAWPGEKMTFVEKGTDNYEVYSAELPADVTGFIFTGTKDDGSGDTDQSPDILDGVKADGMCYYMVWDGENTVKSFKYEVVADTTVAEDTTVADDTVADDTTVVASDDEEESTVADTTVGGNDGYTVYAINSAKWDKVSAYAWTNDGDMAWPGTAMTKTGETVNGFDVYTITLDTAFENIIFNNNNNGSKTADLTFEAGKYYDIKGAKWYDSLADVPAVDVRATDRYLVGEFNSWSTTANEFMLQTEGGNIGYVAIELEANTTYEFKVVREGAWTSCATPITGSVEGLQFSSSAVGPGKDGNATITTTEAGTYVFGFTISSSKLSVVYPTVVSTEDEIVTDPTTPDTTPDDTTPSDTTPVADVYYIHGEFNGWADIALEGEDKVVSATVEIPAGTHSFKIYTGDTWYGNDGTIEDTCEGWTFKTEAGNATLVATGGKYTFTFDTETKKLTITAEIVTPVYNVTWTESDKYTVNAPATVDEGATLEFTVDAAEGYKVAAVIVDMNVLTAVDGVYTIADVKGDVEILVITAEDVVIPEVMEFTVIFVDKDGNELKREVVEYGKAATAPDAPVVDGYTFAGWSEDIDFITKDITVKAQYKKNPTPVEPITTGKLQIEVSGGSGFTIAVNGGSARPQGLSYLNTKMPLAATVTVVANTTNGNEFIGWMNAMTGAIVSTSETYTFTTAGNDLIKALYKTEVAGVNLVTFKNDRAAGGLGQVLDMQYYAAGDEVVFPADPALAGFDFAGWNMTAEEIGAALAAGQDVTVLPTWTAKIVYVGVSVNGGQITAGVADGNGGYLYNNGVTVVADEAESGMKFAYWVDQDGNVRSYKSTYRFNAYYDVELTAVYVAEDAAIAYEAIVGVAADPTVDATRIGYSLFWEISEELGTFVKGGILVVEQKNYNEATFVLGTTDSNVTQGAPGAAQINPQPGYTMNKTNSFVGTQWYAKAFVQYTDVNGVLQTVYSDMIAVDKV